MDSLYKLRNKAVTLLQPYWIFAVQGIWLLGFGWWLCLAHLLLALFCALSLVGIPLVQQHLLLAQYSLYPTYFANSFQSITGEKEQLQSKLTSITRLYLQRKRDNDVDQEKMQQEAFLLRSQLDVQHADWQRQMKHLNDQIKNLQLEANKTSKQLDSLKSSENETTKMNRSLSSSFSRIVELRNKLFAQLRSKRMAIPEKRDNTPETVENNILYVITALESQMDDLRRVHAKLDEEYKKVLRDKLELDQQVIAKDRDIYKLEQHVLELKTELKNEQTFRGNETKRLQKQIDEQAAKMLESNTTLGNYSKQEHDWTEQNKALQKRVDELSAKLEQRNANSSTIFTEISKETAEFARDKEQLEHENAQLHETIHKLRSQLDDYKTKNSTVERDLLERIQRLEIDKIQQAKEFNDQIDSIVKNFIKKESDLQELKKNLNANQKVEKGLLERLMRVEFDKAQMTRDFNQELQGIAKNFIKTESELQEYKRRASQDVTNSSSSTNDAHDRNDEQQNLVSKLQRENAVLHGLVDTLKQNYHPQQSTSTSAEANKNSNNAALHQEQQQQIKPSPV